MILGIPKISVYIITYNQEGVIQRTLESIICQRDYVYEICVSDDCSSDRTWDILLEYDKNYPGLFKLNRNVPNLGIFENTEKVWTMPTGDIVHDLAGDDSVGNGWFKTVIEFIQNNRIDYKNELFCIYGDYKCIYPNGDTVLHKQDAISKYNDAFRLALRGVIGGRGCCYSIKILHKFKNVSKGRSHIAENAMDRQLQIYSEHNYYIPYESNIYYSGIGVSTRITEELKQERLLIWPYSIECFEKFGVNLRARDRSYIKHCMAFQRFLFFGGIRNIIVAVWYYIVSFDFRIFRASDSIHGIVFAIRRRFPHKKPIIDNPAR